MGQGEGKRVTLSASASHVAACVSASSWRSSNHNNIFKERGQVSITPPTTQQAEYNRAGRQPAKIICITNTSLAYVHPDLVVWCISTYFLKLKFMKEFACFSLLWYGLCLRWFTWADSQKCACIQFIILFAINHLPVSLLWCVVQLQQTQTMNKQLLAGHVNVVLPSSDNKLNFSDVVALIRFYIYNVSHSPYKDCSI